MVDCKPWVRMIFRIKGWLGRVTVSLILALAMLQIYHMVLLDRLDRLESDTKHAQTIRFLQKDMQSIFPVIKDSLLNSDIMDSSGNYRIVYNVLRSNISVNDVIVRRYGVTLVTQCSVNHIHQLVQLSHQWQGPVSVAVFVPQQYLTVITHSLLVLHYCIPHIRHNVSVHLVYALMPTRLEIDLPSVIPHVIDCHDFHKVLDTVLPEQMKPAENYDHGEEKYPNNLLRNVALRYVETDYILVTDIDIIPSPNLFKNFVEFARRSSFSSETASLEPQTVYVLPVFEIQRGTELPVDKSELLQLWNRGLVRPFYSELCWKCQKHTDYSTWRNVSRQAGLGTQYDVEWKDPWEPFYISPTRSIPGYDERFKQFGFNRISQVCEAHIAGFKFAVLDTGFLIHLGFKTQESFHHSKDTEQDQNRLLFRRFKEELKTKYPDSTRRCY